MIRFAAASLVCIFCLLDSVPIRAAEITIYRDKYGIPSISAPTLADGVYGLGYAMAQDNAERMARNYKRARGRLAEVDGAALILPDYALRALGIEEMAEAKSHILTSEQSALLTAFCDGANRALKENRGKIPAWIQPFTV